MKEPLMHDRLPPSVDGWLFSLAALTIGMLVLSDDQRFVSSVAWQTAITLSPWGRTGLGVSVIGCAVGMLAVTHLQRRWTSIPFILASLWFVSITVALVWATFTAEKGGTPGFIVWGLVATLLMKHGIGRLIR